MKLRKSIPVQLVVSEQERVSGEILQMTLTGIMVELEKIPFKVASYLTAIIQITPEQTLSLRVRAIKNYKSFIRKQPKKLKPGEKPPVPKMLAELHFQMLDGKDKVAITKFLILQKTGSL